MVRMMVALVLALLAWTPLHAKTNCTLDASVAAFGKVQAHLQAQRIMEMDTAVPPVVRADILALKDALVATVDTRLACISDATPDPALIQKDIATALGANPPAQSDAPAYGSDVRVTVQRPEAASQWLLVQIGFAIECGDDNLLLVYAFRDGAWQPAMRWQSPAYDQISGAFGSEFNSLVLPGPAPKLVVFHGMPWCTSRWSGFGLDVLEPGSEVSKPRVLFHQQHGYVRGDFDPTLKLKADGFEVRAEVGMRDMDVMTRTGIYRYRLDGDQVSRVQPVALNGRDFVDEWLQVKWSEAKAWSDPSLLHELERSHAELAADFGAQKNSKSFTFGAVRSCSDNARVYQVQLDLTSMDKPGKTESRYFRIRSGANSFSMLSAAITPNPLCKGSDLMRKH